VGEAREADDPEGAVVRAGGQATKDVPSHHHAAGAHAHPDRVGQRRQQVREPGRPHLVAQVRRLVTVDQEDIGGLHPGHPSLGADGRERGELEEADDAQPRPVMCRQSWSTATKPRADAGPHIGWPHCAVGMQRAWHSAIGVPSRSTSARRMLAFVTPPDARSGFKVPPGCRGGDVPTVDRVETHRCEPSALVVMASRQDCAVLAGGRFLGCADQRLP
jgi:hypothetical protein